MSFFNFFTKRKFALEITIPSSIEIIHEDSKVRFRGTSEDIDEFAQEFYRLKHLQDGQLCKLGKYTLKVSESISEDRYKPNWIELPNRAWVVMASKFREVATGYEDSPFDFNDCCYTDKNPFDIGVEVKNLPIIKSDR